MLSFLNSPSLKMTLAVLGLLAKLAVIFVHLSIGEASVKQLPVDSPEWQTALENQHTALKLAAFCMLVFFGFNLFMLYLIDKYANVCFDQSAELRQKDDFARDLQAQYESYYDELLREVKEKTERADAIINYARKVALKRKQRSQAKRCPAGHVHRGEVVPSTERSTLATDNQ